MHTKHSFLFIFSIIITLTSSSYFQFQLIRIPSSDDNLNLQPIACANESSIDQDADYKEVCYQKDISYATSFMNEDEIYLMSFDFTTPLSWIKGPSCKIQATQNRCTKKIETLSHKVKEIKHKIAKKFHKKSKAEDEEKQDAKIEGSSQIIRGKLQLSKKIHFQTKDSKVLNNFLDLIMLGLYLRGQKEHLFLESTNFINATSISPNLDRLHDGAISLRFDSTSENSFLNEIFSLVRAVEKTICVYLGQNQTITIGDMTAKYTSSGYSSINWIGMPDDEGFGKWPHINRIGLQDNVQDSQQAESQQIPAILSLSASYIGLPEHIINQFILNKINSIGNCSINAKTYFIQCSFKNKKHAQKMLEKSLYFSFAQHNIMIPFKELIISNAHHKVVINIKKAYINKIILGEPIFKHYVLIFDYSKYKIGFAPKRQNFNEFFIKVVSLIRFLCLTFVIGCSFIICYEPCRLMTKTFGNRHKKGTSEGLSLRQYKAVDQNPYDQINKQVNDALDSTQQQVQGL